MKTVSRRGFLSFLAASPFIAKLTPECVFEESLSLKNFTAACARYHKAEMFIVPLATFKKLIKSMGVDNIFLRDDVATAGFDHVLFRGKPVIPYWPGQRKELLGMIRGYTKAREIEEVDA